MRQPSFDFSERLSNHMNRRSIPQRLDLRSIGCLFAATCFSLVGCRPTTKPDFHSPEPGARNEAIIDAAASKNQAAIPDLVRMLQSDDGATRLLAIRTLERLTGETLGYDYASNLETRRAGIARWENYVRSNQTAESATIPERP
jgi:hypothetical protein